MCVCVCLCLCIHACMHVCVYVCTVCVIVCYSACVCVVGVLVYVSHVNPFTAKDAIWRYRGITCLLARHNFYISRQCTNSEKIMPFGACY